MGYILESGRLDMIAVNFRKIPSDLLAQTDFMKGMSSFIEKCTEVEQVASGLDKWVRHAVFNSFSELS